MINLLKNNWGIVKNLILCIMVLLVVSLLALSTWDSHKKRIKHEEFEFAYNAYYKEYRKTIDDFPHMKLEAESLNTSYDDEIQLPKTNLTNGLSYQLYKYTAESGLASCTAYFFDHTTNFKTEGFNAFDHEIEKRQYDYVNTLKPLIETVPQLNNVMHQYGHDKTLNFKQFCSLINMVNVWMDYKQQLSDKYKVNGIGADF